MSNLSREFRRAVVTQLGKYSKVRQKILSGTSDENISFSDLCQLLMRLGFNERIRGDHSIFTKEGIEEIINLQPKGAVANAEIVIKEWIDTARELGRLIPEPRGRLMFA